MSSGAGRGRGWLNLNRNTDVPRPGVPTSPQTQQQQQQQITNNYPTSEYHELIRRLDQLKITDDGILYNQKIKYILEHWKNECQNKETVEQSFKALYHACLNNVDLATKLVLMVSSQTFLKQEIAETNIRQLFLWNLQDSFENANVLQTNNSTMFRNCVHMIGEFYNKAKLNGTPLKFLVTPFISCLDKLLDVRNLPELILFTKQVYLNGSTVNLQEPDEFSPLFMKIRSILIAETNLQRDHKLWLLLSLDLYYHKFESLPNEIFKFYEDHLGIDEMLYFKKPNNMLSVQTVESNKILDSYRSNVNVLQISTNHDIIDNNKAIPTTKFERNKLDFNIQHQQQQQQQQQQKSGGNRLREKSGRPILGSGARKNFNQTVTTTSGECSSSCSDDVWQDNIDNKWDNSKEKTTTTWGGNNDNKRSIPKHNKGWEHDDRFEINYS